WCSIELNNSFNNNIIEPSIIRRGYYKQQIEEYIKYFSLQSFMFMDFDFFQNDVLNSLNSITHFLGISPFKPSSIDLEAKNVRDYKESLSAELYQKLI